MKQIVCLSDAAWGPDPSRTQQLMARMKGVHVLYFEPAEGRGDQRWRQGGRRVRPGVTVYTLPPVAVQDERLSPLFRLGRRRIARYINRVLDKQRVRDYLLWTTSPEQVHLLDRLGYSALVYDCARDWSDLPERWEGSLAGASDVVFAASHELLDALTPCSANLVLLPNGVNYSLFSGGGNASIERPLPEVEGPVFCRTGDIHADLDLSPVLYAARQRPDWTFVLLGTQDRDNPLLSQLGALDNVVLPGRRPMVDLPEWMARCHVCFDLLRQDAAYSDVIPTRIYEYLSTGKPIVCMLWPDQVEQFPDVIYGAHSPESFLRLCETALQEDRTWVSERRQSYGAKAAWSGRAAEVMRLLDTIGLLQD